MKDKFEISSIFNQASSHKLELDAEAVSEIRELGEPCLPDGRTLPLFSLRPSHKVESSSPGNERAPANGGRRGGVGRLTTTTISPERLNASNHRLRESIRYIYKPPVRLCSPHEALHSPLPPSWTAMRDFVAGESPPLSSLSRDKEGTDCKAERRTCTHRCTCRVNLLFGEGLTWQCCCCWYRA